MKYFIQLPLFFFLYLLASVRLEAQTCCSGGVPLAGGVRLGIESPGDVQLQISYDLNYLNTLSNISENLNDGDRRRYVNAILLEAAYQPGHNFLLGFMFTGVQQYREIYQNGTLTDATAANGIGDVLIYGLYRILERDRQQVSVEGALKIPTGSDQKRSEQGFILPADMQPGTGSWDQFLGIKSKFDYFPLPGWSSQAGILFRRNGTNPDFRGSQEYRFGHSVNTYWTFGRQWLLGKQLMDLSFGPALRWMTRDRVDSGNIPNTGGLWLDGSLGLSWIINKNNKVTWGLTLPIARQLNGIQLSTTASGFLRFHHLFQTKNKAL